MQHTPNNKSKKKRVRCLLLGKSDKKRKENKEVLLYLILSDKVQKVRLLGKKFEKLVVVYLIIKKTTHALCAGMELKLLRCSVKTTRQQTRKFTRSTATTEL